MSCEQRRTGLLNSSQIQDLVSSHEDDFIYGLDYSQQRQIVNTISENLYRESLTNGGKTDTIKVTRDILSKVNSNIAEAKTSKNELESIGLDVGNLTTVIQDNELVRDNINKLVAIAADELGKLNGITIKKLENVTDEKSNDLDEETEAGIERTSFADTYQLELDSRDTTSARLKKFLAFVNDYEFDADTLVAKKSFIGEDLPLNFNYVYNELHRVLEGIESTEKDVLTRLNNVVEEVKTTQNNNLAWLPGFVSYLKAAPKQVRREFVSDMAKHKIDMKFVMYSKVLDKQTGQYKTILRVFDDNSISSAKRLQGLWKKSHINSDIVQEGVYSEEVKNEMLSTLAEIRATKMAADKAEATTTLLGRLGIKVHPDFIKGLFVSGNRMYYGKKNTTGKGLIAKNGVLDRFINQINPGQKVGDSKLLDDSVVVGLSIGSSKFARDEFSNSFRVGDKLIYTYSNNQYIVNRVRDLKKDDLLVSQLQKAQFAKDSLYLELLADQDTGFQDWFDINYLSLNPLKKAKGRRSDKVTSMSPLDMEVTKVGLFNSNRRYEDLEINGITHQSRNAQFFFPTTSDKSRIMRGNGIAIDPVEEITVSNTDGTTYTKKRFKSSAIDLFYDSVVLPEINRIYTTSQPSFKDNVDLSTYNGGLFYLMPELNDLVIKTKDTIVGPRQLLDIVKEDPQLSDNTLKQVRAAIEQFLLRESMDKKKKWKDLGIISNDEKGLPSIQYIEQIGNKEGASGISSTIMDFVYNYALFNANMFQLVIGDPAQYFKSRSDKPMEQALDTYDNIGKRLAAEIAPGVEMEGPDYIQIYSKDVETVSDYFEQILKTLDGLTIDEYNNLDEEAQRKLKAYPYTDITSTDAQEYTTWKEHLNILRDLGRISDTEHEEASKAFKEGRNPSKKVFDKVLQPMKPVYVNNTPMQVGEVWLDKKTYIKSSSFPLIPTLTKGIELDKVRLQLEDIENKEGKGVRLAFKTATKVGFPKNAVSIFDESGVATKIPTDRFEVMDRKGLRIQQDIPYDSRKGTINKGSQESKLLWANILGSNFTYNGEKVKGTELQKTYIDTYKELYNYGLNKLKSKITDNNGKVDMHMISSKLKHELKRRGETSKSLLDGLDVEEFTYGKEGSTITKQDFKIPLWLSPHADKYMSLLNSLVKNNVVSHKLTGKSFVLGSDEGFKLKSEQGFHVTLEEAKKLGVDTGIIFTDKFTGKLQAQHTDSKGVVQPAQIIIPFKFRDNNGNLLKVENFTRKDAEGRTIIDYDKLPKDVLDAFSFRIPTQLHSNMSYAEIVGFLPATSGDLVIAPKEYIIQMGSDFDVDKLYAYLYHAKYNTSTKKLSKTPVVENYRSKMNSLTKILKEARQELEDVTEYPSKVYSYIDTTMEDYKDRGDVINVTAFANHINQVFPEVSTSTLKKIVSGKLEVANLEDSYIGGLHNKLLDIRLAVVSNPAVQSSVLTPLGFGDYLMLADIIDEINIIHSKKRDSIISEAYQTNKFYDGTAGKDGISVFSSDSVFNALAQGKDLIVTEPDFSTGKEDPDMNPISMEFGNKYNESNGNLSKEYSLKKDKPKLKTEVIAAAQNLSVDNANEQGMFKVNMNTYTFGAYSILNFLGFEEDISAPFMSQPILVEYVTKMRESNSILKPFSLNLEEEIIEGLKEKYLGDTEYIIKNDDQLADFKGKDASTEMLKMLSERIDYPDFDKYQVAILNKFLRLKSYEQLISPLKQLLNIDSKGFNPSMYVNKQRVNFVETLEDYQILNADKLIGEYSSVMLAGFKAGVIIEPTTLAGLDNIMGTKNLISMFGNFFTESNPKLRFDKIVKDIAGVVSDSGKLSTKVMKEVKDAYKSFLISNFNVEDVSNLRKDIFTQKDSGSLYDNLMKLKETGYWANNTFLNGLDIEFVDGVLSVDYNNAAGDNFDETSIYLSFIDLFRQGGEINGVIPAVVGEDLVKYSLLRGEIKAKQFQKIIPPDIINMVVDIPTEVVETNTFVDQWMRHNAEKTPQVDQYKEVAKDTIQITDRGIYPNYVNVKGKKDTVKLYKVNEAGFYELINQLGADTFTEYSVAPVNSSILKTNNLVNTQPIKADYAVVAGRKEGVALEGIQVQSSETLASSEPVGVNNVIDDLDMSSGSTLLKSIMELDGFKEYSNLAKAIKNQVPTDLRLIVEDGRSMSFSPDLIAIRLGTERMQEMSSDELLSGIMHEYMHAVTNDNIEIYLADGKLDPKVKDAIIRLNNYKNEVISRLAGSREQVFKNVMVRYFNSLSDAKRVALQNDTTMHTKVSGWLDTVHRYKQDPTIDLDGTIADMIAKANDTDYDYSTNVVYYSLMNLKEFSAVSSTSDNARKLFKDVVGEGYIERIRELFNALLQSLGITSESAKGIVSDILTVAEVEVADTQEVVPETLVERNIAEKAVFKFSDGNSYIMDGDTIYNIARPERPVFVNEGNQRSAFIKKYIKDLTPKINYSLNSFENGAFRKFTRNGVTYDSVTDYLRTTDDTANTYDAILDSFKQNPKDTAKLMRYMHTEPTSMLAKSLTHLHNDLMQEFDFENSKVVEVKEPVFTGYSKHNLPKKATSMIGTGKAAKEFTTDLDQMFQSLEQEGEEIRKDCISKSPPKAQEGMRGDFQSGTTWKVVKDLKGLPSHAKGGVNLRIDNNKTVFTSKSGDIEARYGLYIPNDGAFNRAREKQTAEGIKYKNKNYPGITPGKAWSTISYGEGKAYAENGLVMPRTKKNTDFTQGTTWTMVKDLEGKPSHNQGGIDIFVDKNNNTGFSRDESKILARCGLVIKAKKK